MNGQSTKQTAAAKDQHRPAKTRTEAKQNKNPTHSGRCIVPRIPSADQRVVSYGHELPVGVKDDKEPRRRPLWARGAATARQVDTWSLWPCYQLEVCIDEGADSHGPFPARSWRPQ
jgi:hypothetical protein